MTGVWSSNDIALTEAQMIGSEQYVDGPWRYERIEGAGHWMQLDAPDQLNRILLDFLYLITVRFRCRQRDPRRLAAPTRSPPVVLRSGTSAGTSAARTRSARTEPPTGTPRAASR